VALTLATPVLAIATTVALAATYTVRNTNHEHQLEQ